MQLSKDTTLSYHEACECLYPLKMDPREALDQTIKHFGLVAKTLAEAAGIGDDRLSKYRKKTHDMVSVTVFKMVAALPRTARFHFYSLVEPEIEEVEIPLPRVAETSGIYTIDSLSVPPDAYTSYLWQYLSINQIAPAELRQRLEVEGWSRQQILQIFNGKAPTAEELQTLTQVLSDLPKNGTY